VLGGVVRGKTTTLRTPVEADLPTIAAWMADLRVRRSAAVWGEPATAATWKERLAEQAKDRESALWSIEAAGRLVGLTRISYGWPRGMSQSVDVTHLLIDPAEWRRGLGFDAALALHRYVFDYLHVQRTEVALRADNAAALRIAERLGYREYAHGHAVHWRDGGYVDELRLRMDLASWDERFGASEREYEPFAPEAEE